MHSETRVPTVDDLRVKLCFICRDEERYDNREEPPRAWTHPCSCTLIAHESCLLQWIKAAQQDPSKAKNALKCPQCGSKYEIESQNPFILRFLDHVNASLSVAGKFVSVTGMTGVIVAFGFGIYIICTSYGAFALQEFIGKEMYDLLLTDDPSNWPWHAFINLPLIPISLVLSRTRYLNTLSLAPLFLAWSSSPPVRSAQVIIASQWNPSLSGAGTYPFAPVLSWPPSPIVITAFFPFITTFYRRVHSIVKHRIMGTEPAPHRPIREFVWDFGGADGQPPLRARIGVNIDEGRHADHEQQPAQGQNGGNQDQEGQQADEPGVVAERTLRINNASLGRFLGGALMMPAIANRMGSILLRLSRHSKILRYFLAIRPSVGGVTLNSPGRWIEAQRWNEMSYFKQIALSLRIGADLVCGGTRTWHDCDPVWWRNSIGLGIFIVAKDCIKLLHLYLAKRELETRRIKSRSFAGVDVKELDLIDSPHLSS